MTIKPSTRSGIELGCAGFVAAALVSALAYAVYEAIKAIVDALVSFGG